MVGKLDVNMQGNESVHLWKITKISGNIGLQTLIPQKGTWGEINYLIRHKCFLTMKASLCTTKEKLSSESESNWSFSELERWPVI